MLAAAAGAWHHTTASARIFAAPVRVLVGYGLTMGVVTAVAVGFHRPGDDRRAAGGLVAGGAMSAVSLAAFELVAT